VPHPRGGDRQRSPTVGRTARQLQLELALTGSQPLPRHRLQQLQIRIGVRRADVLDVA